MKVRDASHIKALQPAAGPDGPRYARDDGQRSDRVTTAASDRVASAISDAAHAAGVARATRLAKIEGLVREGAYRPDPQRIAQQILNEAEITARIQALLHG